MFNQVKSNRFLFSVKRFLAFALTAVFAAALAVPAFAEPTNAGSGFYFEDFGTLTVPSDNWTGGKQSGGTVYVSNSRLEVERTLVGGMTDATYTLPEAINSGTVVVEFDMAMNGTDAKQALFRFRNSESKNLVQFQPRQNQGLYIRMPPKATAFTRIGGSGVSLASGEVNHIRTEMNLDAESGQVKIFINGVQTTIGDADSIDFQEELTTKELQKLNFTVSANSAQDGSAFWIDNLKVYQKGTSAEKAADSANALKIDGDLTMVTSDLTLPTQDVANGTSITWASSDTNVIKPDGTVTRPAEGDANVVLTATIIDSSNTILCKKEFNVTVLKQGVSEKQVWLFEHFDAAPSSAWALAGSGGVSKANEDRKLEISRNRSGGTANAMLTLPEELQKTTGKFAVEFRIACDAETDGKEFQVSGRIAGTTKNHFWYFIAQGPTATPTIRTGASASTPLDGYQRTTKGTEIHMKIVVDYDAGEAGSKGLVSTYINGRLSEITQPFLQQDLIDTPIDKIYFNYVAEQIDGRVLIDDVKVYNILSTPSDAELLAGYTYDLAFPSDPANVANSVTLPTEDAENGVSISWTSSNPDVISETGEVNRPTDADATVVMTATLTKGAVTDKKEFVCTVPANRGAVSYVEQNQLLAQTGLQITHVRPGETVTGVVKINNDTASTESGILLLALYDRNGTLVDVKYEPYSVSANTAGFEKTLAIAIPDAPGYTVKRMVWTGFDSLMPIVSAVSAD